MSRTDGTHRIKTWEIVAAVLLLVVLLALEGLYQPWSSIAVSAKTRHLARFIPTVLRSNPDDVKPEQPPRALPAETQEETSVPKSSVPTTLTGNTVPLPQPLSSPPPRRAQQDPKQLPANPQRNLESMPISLGNGATPFSTPGNTPETSSPNFQSPSSGDTISFPGTHVSPPIVPASPGNNPGGPQTLNTNPSTSEPSTATPEPSTLLLLLGGSLFFLIRYGVQRRKRIHSMNS